MKEYKVPIQSLIDHIKTACDVDPWAKEMAEDLLKEQEPVKPSWRQGKAYCGACGIRLPMKRFKSKPYCSHCGRKVQWHETED